MSYMRTIATDILGLSWIDNTTEDTTEEENRSEKFKISGNNNYFIINADGLFVIDDENPSDTNTKATSISRRNNTLLLNILTGDVSIEYLPFIPKVGQEYWFVDMLLNKVSRYKWSNSSDEKYFLKHNLIERTEKQAKDKLEKIKEFLSGNIQKWEDK